MAAMANIEAQPAPVRRTVVSRIKDALRPLEPYLALQGMAGRLGEIDGLVVETSTIATVKGGTEIGAVVQFLNEPGFVVADIIGLKRRPLDGATAQVDLLFVPEASPIRTDRRWSGATNRALKP